MRATGLQGRWRAGRIERYDFDSRNRVGERGIWDQNGANPRMRRVECAGGPEPRACAQPALGAVVVAAFCPVNDRDDSTEDGVGVADTIHDGELTLGRVVLDEW